MNTDLEKKGIRSEKVSHIMGEEPPWLVRYGTVIITAILIVIGVVTFYYVRSW